MTRRCLQLEGVELHHSEGFGLGPVDAELTGTVGIVGRNGSGKSTLFRLLTGCEDPHRGTITWAGEPVFRENSQYKRIIGFLPQPLELPLWSSAGDLLEYTSRLRGTPPAARKAQIEAALELWQVSTFVHKPLIACSYGMRKRVALTLALVHEPELLILDEPLSGLDVVHVMTLQQILQRRHEAGLVTIFSSHMMSFVAAEALQVLVINQGAVHSLVQWPQLAPDQRIKALHQQIPRAGSAVVRQR